MPNKTLVVWYSLTGNTRKLGRELAASLGAVEEELIETPPRKGALRMLGILVDVARRSSSSIQRPVQDPARFDLVLLGTPVWAGRVAPAMRTYAKAHAARAPKVAFFATMGTKQPGKCFQELESLCGRAPVATLALSVQQLEPATHRDPMAAFVAQLGS